MDTYSALWVSYSSLSDFLLCPRAYFLRNVYKDPQTNRKLGTADPRLSVGQVVHEVLDEQAQLPAAQRFQGSPDDRFSSLWTLVQGKQGGFTSQSEEQAQYARGLAMLKKVWGNPGPLSQPAIRIRPAGTSAVPYFWLSEEEGIILCGALDWLEYLPESETVHIIDFKTGLKEEKEGSLQLPIYMLLAQHCQRHPVSRASYWYLDQQPAPTEMPLPDAAKAAREVLDIAKDIAWARREGRLSCPTDGCFHCQPFEDILNGQAELVATDHARRRDIYLVGNHE